MDSSLALSLMVGIATLGAILLATYYAGESGIDSFSLFDVLDNRAMPVLLAIFYGILLLLLGALILALTVILLVLIVLLGALCVGLTVEFVTELNAPGAFSSAMKRWNLLGLYWCCCFAWPIFIFSIKQVWRDLLRMVHKCRGDHTAGAPPAT